MKFAENLYLVGEVDLGYRLLAWAHRIVASDTDFLQLMYYDFRFLNEKMRALDYYGLDSTGVQASLSSQLAVHHHPVLTLRWTRRHST